MEKRWLTRDKTVEPPSREQTVKRERDTKKYIFSHTSPVQPTPSRIGNLTLYPVDPLFANPGSICYDHID